MAITLTESAVQHIKIFIAKRGKDVGLRLGVKTTGCSGMSYVVEYADSIEEDDVVFDDKGIKVVVSSKSLVFLDGMQLDYSREGVNEGLKFINPNEKGRCGCGESFNI